MFGMMKKDDSGFSLVELIIVIAIMAILVGVVGTQVIPYLEKSKVAKDQQVFSGWNTAGMSAYSMNAAVLDPTEEYAIVIKNGSVTCTNASLVGADDLITTFCELTQLQETGASNQISGRMDSKEGAAVKAVKITIPVMEGGSPRITTRMYLDEAMNTESLVFDRIENQ